MATLPLMGLQCLSCDVVPSSKLVAVTGFDHGRLVIPSLGTRPDDGNPISDRVTKNAVKCSHRCRNLKVTAKLRSSVVQTAKNVSTYMFRTEVGGLVKVFVEKKINKYDLCIQVSSLELDGREEELIVSWGIFRSDSSSFMPLDSQNSGLDGISTTVESPLVRRSIDRLALELDFQPSLVPFYFSFVFKSRLDGDLIIRSNRGTNFVLPVGFGSGYPAPLGQSFLSDGSRNFAVITRSAESVILCFYDNTSNHKPTLEIDLDSHVNRSGDVWHVSIESAGPFASYGYRCKGVTREGVEKCCAEHVLLDPYAKIVGNFGSPEHGSSLLPKSLGQLCEPPVFDWGRDISPCLPMEKLVVYRLNVLRFSIDKSSKLPNDIAGTFSGVIEKLHHFKELGVNAILLEPIFHFDEQKGPYFPWHFFSPSNKYGSSNDPMSAINSMREMVKKFHANGIEIFLEVVFTHTAECATLREIDNSYYSSAKSNEDLRYRNDLNCNHPIVQQLILDSLRNWVIEFHIDGFVFVNASSLLRGFHGEILSRPPLIEAIAFDPVLSKSKIIADSWDPYEMAFKENRFPHWKRWAEINKQFCDDVRNFLRGEGLLSNLATRLCGSGDIFLDGRGPSFSFNYVARNFGLSLVDLVSYNGSKVVSELSWNCGEEGPTNKIAVLEKRLKQIRNFLFILFVSRGVPVLNMGDESGQSSGGSTAYGSRKPFNWNTLATDFGVQTTQFISFLTLLRMRRSDLFQKSLKEENIDWHGNDNSTPKWDDPSSKFLAMRLKTKKEDNSKSSSHGCSDLFIAFNVADDLETVILPPPPEEMAWIRLVDTALPYPGYFSVEGDPLPERTGSVTYEMKSYSCVLFEARNPIS